MYQRKAKYLFQLSDRANNHLGKKDTSLLNLKRSSLITQVQVKVLTSTCTWFHCPFQVSLSINFFYSIFFLFPSFIFRKPHALRLLMTQMQHLWHLLCITLDLPLIKMVQPVCKCLWPVIEGSRNEHSETSEDKILPQE